MKKSACVTNQLIIKAIILSFSAIVICLTGCSSERKPELKRSIFVSIPPQKMMVQQIAGDLFNVDYLVQPGHSPATYEPTLAQMEDLSGAELFFRIGVPFEEIWVHRIRDINPEMKIIDVRDSISLQPLDDYQTLINKSLMSPHAGEKDHDRSSDD
ncbi:MAG: zinc ABC transporter substrate-binding protein, partial [Candidatus Cloacimonetes bacterium]|nr:zinc ABC transporter substrate-binding protein [Candidatus Cloacimonadota bacterium]